MYKVGNYILLTLYKYSSRFDSLEYNRNVVRLQTYSRLALGIKSSICWKISVCYSQESVLLLQILFRRKLSWPQLKALLSSITRGKVRGIIIFRRSTETGDHRFFSYPL